ncbi:MAG: hydroxyacylglutathione hydrolase [Candidatus Binatia bacterium]
MRVVPVPQLTDNYAYLIIDEATGKAGVVDCAEAPGVLRAAADAGVELLAILPTHHHWDHVGGHEALLHQRSLTVYGYAGEGHRIPGCTVEVAEGDVVTIGTLAARILFIPAHTSGHVAYYFNRERAVFTGDTLFAGGCGRLFEGDAAMMMRSLSKLAVLPDDTRVYFGHEYTEKNLRFARTLEPDNAALRDKLAWAAEQVRQQRPTVPTTIASEKATNPFLRWTSPELRATLRRQFPDLPDDDVAIFAKTRALKDAY